MAMLGGEKTEQGGVHPIAPTKIMHRSGGGGQWRPWVSLRINKTANPRLARKKDRKTHLLKTEGRVADLLPFLLYHPKAASEWRCTPKRLRDWLGIAAMPHRSDGVIIF